MLEVIDYITGQKEVFHAKQHSHDALASLTPDSGLGPGYRDRHADWRSNGPKWLRVVGCLLIAGSLNTVQSFIACFGLATLGVDLSLSSSWTTCSDVGRELTGTLSGSMNMMGSLGAFCSSLAFPYLLKITGNPQTYFLAAAALDALAVLCWLGVRPERPLGK